MRIRAFSVLIKEHLESFQLENTEVVVDGQNIYYKLYEKSGVPFLLGSECDKFANYVRKYISIFKKANLKCHFIVKGGHDSEKSLDIHFKLENRLYGKQFVLGEHYDEIIQPCMAKDIYLQVLEEMGFDYTISQATDVIKECFELAQRLSCPVLSFNIQYCFSSVPYVPIQQGNLLEVKQNNHLICGIFKRETFLQHYRISKEKMILFILLTDAHVFKEDYFLPFFKACKILYNTHTKRYKALLKWLSRRSETAALQKIVKYISKSDKETFFKNKNELEIKFLKTHTNEESVTSLYFTNRNSLNFDIQDPHWFEKGIALKYIAIPYVNLYYWGLIVASRLVEDYDQENSILFSKDIIKYAYDLLQNFNGKNIYIKYRNESNDEELSVVHTQSVRKPDYVAQICVFENGWENIDSRGLFEHFFIETFGSFNFAALEMAPADVRLLLVSLVYFKRNKEDDVTCEIYSIILSYVLLGVVAEKVSHEPSDPDSVAIVSRPLLDSTTRKELVTTHDCAVAERILKEYRTVSDYELYDIFNPTKIHPLFQFEWCLLHVNDLNTLCGSPYTSTEYSKTYNGTFVYKFLCSIKEENALQQITDLLNPAPSVLSFTLGIIEMYEKILYELSFTVNTLKFHF